MTSGKPFKGFFRCPKCNTVVTLFGDKRECNICLTLSDGNPDTGDMKVVTNDSQVETSPNLSPYRDWSSGYRYPTSLSNRTGDYGTQMPEFPIAKSSQVQPMQQSTPTSPNLSLPDSPLRELENLHLGISELSKVPVKEPIRSSGPSSVHSGRSSAENEDTFSKKSWSPVENDESFRFNHKKNYSCSESGSSKTRSMRKLRSPLSTDANKEKECSAYVEGQFQESTHSSTAYGRNSGTFSHFRPRSSDSEDIYSELSWTASEKDDSTIGSTRSSTYTHLSTRLTEPESDRGFYDQGSKSSGFSFSRMEDNQQQFRQKLPKDRPFGEPILPPNKGYCCKHCKPETCRPFERFSPSPCCNNGMCKDCNHCCCGGGSWYGSSSESFCCHHSHKYRKAEVASRPEQALKRFCLPVCGAINFILCYNCSSILQVPTNFQFMKNKNNKLMCGNCKEVLSYSLSNGINIVPTDDSYGDYAQEDETSKSEPVLHRLMGYYSARDILRDGGSSRVRL